MSLRSRAALAGGLAAALAGGLAAAVSGVSAYRGVVAAEDAELLRAATDFVGELYEELEEGDDEDSPQDRAHFRQAHGERTLPNLLVHEAEDLELPGVRTALWRDGAVWAGAALPHADAGQCASSRSRDNIALRACTVPYDEAMDLVFAAEVPAQDGRVARFAGAIALGALLGAVLGALGSLLAATWATAPLVALRERVASVRPEQPDPSRLAEPVADAELDALRATTYELLGRLAESLDHARTFSARAAHELRTPLTALRGELELLAEARPDDPVLARLRAQVQTLVDLVQRLLALSNRATDLAHTGTTVDLSDVLWDAVGQCAQPERVQASADDDALVRGDAHLLRVALGNALDNALKYSEGPVRVAVRRGEDAHTIEVSDDGPGVPPAVAESLFSPFVRGAGTQVAGHGLGLALLRQVAAAHGGSARFVPRTRGACLQLSLPPWRATSRPRAPSPGTSPADGT